MTKTNEKIHVLADESLGGIKREYVEVDRKAKVGDMVVLPGEGNSAEHVVEVRGFEGDYKLESGFYIRQDFVNTLEPTNIVHIDGERYEMVDRKAEVGEKVVVVNDEDSSEEFGNFRIGEVGTVESYATDDTYFGEYANVRVSDGRDIPLYLHEYRVLVPVESSEEEPQPSDPIDVIANLATRVAELERQVKKLNAALPEDMKLRAESTQRYLALQDEIDTLHKDSRRHGEELARLEKGMNSQAQRHVYRQQEIERVWERMDQIEAKTEALKHATEETDGKVAHLEADIEESFPATDAPLVFICRKPGRFEVYQDGKKLHGVMSVRINAKVGEFATHEIEYISGATEEERQ